MLAEHPDVRKISFTGSVATGKKIMRLRRRRPEARHARAGRQRSRPSCSTTSTRTRSPSGSSGARSRTPARCAPPSSGSTCTRRSTSRSSRGLVERAKTVKVGDGLDPDTQLGPINNKMQLERVMGLVDDARKNGGTHRSRRRAARGLGLLLSADHRHRRRAPACGWSTRSSSAPRCRSSSTRNLDDVLEQANRTHYGLGGSVWTGDLERGEAARPGARVRHRLGEPAHGHHAVRAVRRLQVERHRLRERPWGYEEFTEMQVVNTKKTA